MGRAISMVLLAVVLATLYFCDAQLSVSVASSRVRWSVGSDAIAAIDIGERFQITLSGLEPNATTLYTDALEFSPLPNSAKSCMKLEIISLADSNAIIWGIRFYIFKSGTRTATLTLVDGSSVLIGNTDGGVPVCAVGYRQMNADVGYGSPKLPVDSGSFIGINSTTYTIAVEVYGRDEILSAEAAALQLGLLWS
jgi:hypothetical protein